MMRGLSVVLLLAFFFVSLPAFSGERPIVAVFNMEDRGAELSEGVLEKMTDYLMAQMAGGGYQVIPREEIKERLRAQQIDSYKLCYDEKCQIELGRELAAQMSLASQVMKIGDKCQVTALLYDLKKAATINAANAEAPCDETSLIQALKSIASKLRRVSEDAGVGILLVKSDPSGAKVIVDGDEVGTSPVTVKDLPAGHHVVEASRGEARSKQTVKVLGDEVTRVSLDLTGRKFFNVTIFSEPPEASINWNGKDVGKAPVVLKDVEQGTHRIHSVSEGCLPRDEEVVVYGDSEFTVKLLPDKRVVRLRTEPEGAELVIDGRPLGKSPVDAEVAANNTYMISASATGYHSSERRVRVEPSLQSSGPMEVYIKLDPNPYGGLGHLTFWSGIGLMSFGGVSAVLSHLAAEDYKSGDIDAWDRSRIWSGLMWAGFGTGASLVATGIILWVVSAPGNSEDISAPVALTPTVDGNGMVLTFFGSW